MSKNEAVDRVEVIKQAGKVFEATNKLVYEVARLRTDIARLHSRIEPFEGEVRRPDPLPADMKFRTFLEALDGIADARASIQSCEYHLSSIRGMLDGISSDAISREEMRPWLKGK
jgi:hypothetical protein